MLEDVRLALRGFRRTPGFTAVAVVALALGIGANTAVFSVVDALVLRSLPYRAPGELITIHARSLQTGRVGAVSFPDMADVRSERELFAALAIYRPRGLVLSGRGEPETVSAVVASAELFAVLGVAPALGRAFASGEDEPGRPRLAVISDGLWRRLGATPQLVGGTLVLDGAPVTVIGVAPAGFRFPLDDRPAELWVTLDGGIDREARQWRSMLPYRSAIARLKSGVTVAQAQAALDVIRSRLARQYPKDDAGSTFLVRSFREEWGGGRTALLVLLGAVGLVLLVACANVANLQLSRALARQREFAIRRALGASRSRLARQLLTESFLLALAGAALAVATAAASLDVLAAAVPADLARPHAIRLDLRVLGYTLAIAVGTGALVGVAPAVLATRTDLRAVLAASDRAITSRGRARSVLLVAEIALAFVLVIGAGLLVRTFARVSGLDPGFDARSMLTARIKASAYHGDGKALYRALAAALPRIAGAQGVALGAPLPFGGWSGGTMSFTLDDRPPPPADAPWWALWGSADPGYFSALGVPILQGRVFDAKDAAAVAVVNESFARRYFPDRSPLGRHILAYRRFDWRIVGVVGDTRGSTCPPAGCRGSGDENRLEQLPEPAFYTSLAKGCCPPDLYVAIRHPMPWTAAGPLRALVREIDPALPVEELRTMDEAIGRSLAERRLHTLLLGGFSALALLLAVLGLYGVLSYAVLQRTRELAIRRALGAQDRQLVRLVVRQGLRLAVLGLVAGTAGAFALTRVLASQLYAVTATDPITFLAVAGLLLAVAALASYLPARRATRIDPIVALKEE